MATKKSADDEPVDFDSLLDNTPDDAVDPLDDLLNVTPDDEPAAPEEGEADLEETPDQKRIRELEEQLAAPRIRPAPEPDEDDEEELTPDQLRIKELEDKLARRHAEEVEEAAPDYAPPAKGDAILIHVLIDGFVALGEVWYRGQEMEFEVGKPSYEQTKDRNGETWVSLRDDVQAQFDRWGKQYIASGPFRARKGEKFSDSIAKADARRGRSVPLIRG